MRFKGLVQVQTASSQSVTVGDITKIALTAIPAWKAILTMLSKVRKARRR